MHNCVRTHPDTQCVELVMMDWRVAHYLEANLVLRATRETVLDELANCLFVTILSLAYL